MDRPDWLPGRLHYEDYKDDWLNFLNDAYKIFLNDFCKDEVFLGDMKVDFDHRIFNERYECFRHIVEGSANKGMVKDANSILRAERIGWIKLIILNYYQDCIYQWENKRGRKTKVLLWLKDVETMGYVVIFYKKINKTVFLETAYPVTWKRRRIQFEKEYNSFISSKRRP